MYNSKGGIMIDKALRKILKLPHISNAGQNLHEEAVMKEFVSVGLKETTVEELGLTKKQVKSCTITKKVKPNIFVSQPCGSQSFPDFIISDKNGTVHYIECKSSKQDKIIWNSGFPKDHGIYIHSSGRHNKQSIVMGSDLWDSEDSKLLFEAFSKMKEIEKEYKKKLKSSSLSPYCREMFNDNGKISGHPERGQRIKRVFQYLAEVRDAK